MLCTAGDITSKGGGQVQTLVDFLFSGRSGVGTPETLVLLSLPLRRPSPSSMCIHQHLTPTLYRLWSWLWLLWGGTRAVPGAATAITS